MADLPNFYENIKEAQMRLQHTVVMYDKAPYYVLTIADGHPDNIFRVYMEPHGNPNGSVLHKYEDLPHETGDAIRRALMDAWMIKYPDSGVIRRTINSPQFNKFRPFDLGMCNIDGRTTYLERMPQRHTQQGLVQNMISQTPVELATQQSKPTKYGAVGFMSPALRSTILGEYPAFKDCLKNLLDPDVVNESVGFHRNFALLRGPIETMFISYKGDTIGMLPNNDDKTIRICSKYAHTKEVVQGLSIFQDIQIK